MRKKPESCKGCPLYQTGRGFVPDEVIDGAEVFVLGQNPGSTEEIQGRPFCGDTGQVMERVYFPLAGLERGDNVSIGNTIRCRVQASNRMPTGDMWHRAVNHCSAAHLRIPESTRLIVAQGYHAFRALGGKGGIHEWRGFTLPKGGSRSQILCTLHIADVPREPTMALPTKKDWTKVRSILGKSWPLPDPQRLTRTEYDYEVRDWFDRAVVEAPFIVIDGEWPKGKLTLLGLGYPGSTVLQWCNPTTLDKAFLSHLKTLVRCKPVVYHNAKADIPKLREQLGIDWEDHYQIEDTMLGHSRLWVELPHNLEFCASIYGRHRKMKHLSGLMYNVGDVAETAWLQSALDREFSRDKASHQAYLDDMECLPHVEECESIGIRVDEGAVRGIQETITREVEIARAISSAYVGAPFNLGSSDQCLYWLQSEGFKLRRKRGAKTASVDKDAVSVLRQKHTPYDPKEEITSDYILTRIRDHEAHPLLEARALWTATDYVVTHYLNPLKGKERVHSNIKMHSQNNHRWSWTEPPLATVPAFLRHIFAPDPGWPWIEFDWDGIELRIIACEARSAYLLEVLLKNYDLHTLTCCDVFGLPYPPDMVDPHKSATSADWRSAVAWRGKDDIRRVFSKTFRYRLNYGGDPAHCGDVPGARTLALDGDRLVDAAMSIKSRDPDLARWWANTERQARETGMARDWRGRLRRFFTRDTAEMVRQAYDFGMQAGVQSIAVLTLNEIKRKFRCDVHLKYGMHDSMKLAAREERYDTIRVHVKEIVQQPRVINGIEMAFPATFAPMRTA